MKIICPDRKNCHKKLRIIDTSPSTQSISSIDYCPYKDIVTAPNQDKWMWSIYCYEYMSYRDLTVMEDFVYEMKKAVGKI
jgi:hypothetical protein